MVSANRDNLTSLFLIWIPFIPFYCLNALARTSSSLLNRSGEWTSFSLKFWIPKSNCLFNISTQMPGILKLTYLYQTFLLHPKMFQLNFASHPTAGLVEGRRGYNWLLFFPHYTFSPLPSSSPGLNRIGRRRKVAEERSSLTITCLLLCILKI